MGAHLNKVRASGLTGKLGHSHVYLPQLFFTVRIVCVCAAERPGVGWGGDGVLPQGQLCATTYPVRSRTTPSSPGVPSCHVTRTPSPPCTTPTLWLHSCVLQDQNCIISRRFYVNGIKQQVTFGDWLMSLRRTPRRSTGLLRVPSHCRVVVPTQAPSSRFLRTVTDGGPTGCSWGKPNTAKQFLRSAHQMRSL